MARALKGLIAVSISVALALGLAEAILQLVNLPAAEFSPWIRAEDTAYRHAAGLSTRMRRAPEYDVLFETNQAGLRDDEIDENHDGMRIVLLGDSFTSGYGVERGDLFADLLEHRLQTDGGSTIDVINAPASSFLIGVSHLTTDARRPDPCPPRGAETLAQCSSIVVGRGRGPKTLQNTPVAASDNPRGAIAGQAIGRDQTCRLRRTGRPVRRGGPGPQVIVKGGAERGLLLKPPPGQMTIRVNLGDCSNKWQMCDGSSLA